MMLMIAIYKECSAHRNFDDFTVLEIQNNCIQFNIYIFRCSQMSIFNF